MKTKTGLLSRRDCLKLAGSAALAAPVVSWAAEDAKDMAKAQAMAKAKANLRLAIFTGVYADLPLDEACRRIKADGFSGVVCDYSFADVRFDPLAPDWPAATKILDCLERSEVKVVGLYGYYNVVSPDAESRKRGEQRMEFLIENWKRLGSNVISTETGTLNRESEWNDSPDNATETAYQQCRASLQRSAEMAEKTGAIIAIEPYWKNVISSAERTERLFREIQSPALRLVMDPCNYFRKADLGHMDAMLKDIFQRVGSRTVLAHAKDVKASATADDTELPAAGQGVLDYPEYLRLLAGLDRELFLALEHLDLDEVHATRDYVLAQFDKV